MRGLLKHLLYIRETWVRTHLSDDLNAITERAYHVWPNRLRGSFTLLKKKGVASAKRLKKSCEKRIQGKTRKSSSPAPDCDNGNGHGDAAKEQSIGTCVGLYGSNKYTTCMNEEQSDEDTNISSDNGVDIDGDLSTSHRLSQIRMRRHRILTLETAGRLRKSTEKMNQRPLRY